MNGLWTVTRRELAEWKPVVWLTVALLILVWCLPWLPGIAPRDPELVRSLGATVVTQLVGLGLAFLLGTSLLGRELSEGRLGFYLSQPLSAAQIWIGKVLACLLILIGFLGVLQLPARAESAWLLPSFGYGAGLARSPTKFAAVGLLLLLLVVLLAHAIGTGVRSRSAWLALDAAGFTLTAGSLILAFLAFHRYYALEQLQIGTLVWLPTVVIGWLVAGWLQVKKGGSSLKQGHRWLAVTGWGIMALASLGLFQHGRWTQGGTINEVQEIVNVESAPQGPWVGVVAHSPRRSVPSSFLFNSETGASVLVNQVVFWDDEVIFDASASRAYAVRGDRFQRPHLVAWSLGDDAVQLAIPLLDFTSTPRLAANDGFLATWTRNDMRLYRVDPWKLEGRIDIDEKYWSRPWALLPNGTIRVFAYPHRRSSGTPTLWQFDGEVVEEVRFAEELGPITWYSLEDHGRTTQFIADGLLYHYDPEDGPPRVVTATTPLGTSKPVEVAEAGLFTQVLALNGSLVIADRAGKETQIRLVGPTPQETRIPGLIESLQPIDGGQGGLLTVLENGETTFYRLVVSSSGRLEPERLSSHPGFLRFMGGQVFSSRTQLVRFSVADGEPTLLLPRQDR